jgi:hypothetical protein
MCETDECYLGISITVLLLYAVFTWFGWNYAIRIGTGDRNRALSAVLALFIPPVYAIVYAFQFPIRTTDRTTYPLFTAAIAFLFWPFVFFLPILNDDDGSDVRMNANVSENGDWV